MNHWTVWPILLVTLVVIWWANYKIRVFSKFYNGIEKFALWVWFVEKNQFDDTDANEEDCIGTLAVLFAAVITQGISLVIVEQANDVRITSIAVYSAISVMTLLAVRRLVTIVKPDTSDSPSVEPKEHGDETDEVGEVANNDIGITPPERYHYYFGRGSIMFGKFVLTWGSAIFLAFVVMACANLLPGQAREFVRSDEYTYKDAKEGAYVLFKTRVDSESATAGFDRCLKVKWTDEFNDNWNVITVQVFSDQELKKEKTKLRLGPILDDQPGFKNLKARQFFLLPSCKKETYWVKILLEPNSNELDRVDDANLFKSKLDKMRKELDVAIKSRRIIDVSNDLYPQEVGN